MCKSIAKAQRICTSHKYTKPLHLCMANYNYIIKTKHLKHMIYH